MVRSDAPVSPRGDTDASVHWMLWGLVLPLIVYAVRAVEILTRTEIPFDSVHTYLPLARQLLEDASTLFNNPESLKVAPGAVVYMALAGATPLAVKMANLGISLLALVLAFDAARRIGGRTAAVAAAWLFVLPHMLLEAGMVLMGESPFIFLVSVWLWATVYATGASPGSKQARLRIAAVVLGGLALGAATLTRATYTYCLPFAAVTSFVASRSLQGVQRGVGQLHLGVVQHRLKTEYDADIRLENCHYTGARWITADSPAELRTFTDAYPLRLAHDAAETLACLCTDPYDVRLARERFPKIRFSPLREHAGLALQLAG